MIREMVEQMLNEKYFENVLEGGFLIKGFSAGAAYILKNGKECAVFDGNLFEIKDWIIYDYERNHMINGKCNKNNMGEPVVKMEFKNNKFVVENLIDNKKSIFDEKELKKAAIEFASIILQNRP
jgi:hypothetical protein